MIRFESSVVLEGYQASVRTDHQPGVFESSVVLEGYQAGRMHRKAKHGV